MLCGLEVTVVSLCMVGLTVCGIPAQHDSCPTHRVFTRPGIRCIETARVARGLLTACIYRATFSTLLWRITLWIAQEKGSNVSACTIGKAYVQPDPRVDFQTLSWVLFHGAMPRCSFAAMIRHRSNVNCQLCIHALDPV